MDTQIFDSKFKFFEESLKFDDNIKWYIHSSKYYEIRKYNYCMFFYIRYGHTFFVAELNLPASKYKTLKKYNYYQVQYLYKLFIVSTLYV